MAATVENSFILDKALYTEAAKGALESKRVGCSIALNVVVMLFFVIPLLVYLGWILLTQSPEPLFLIGLTFVWLLVTAIGGEILLLNLKKIRIAQEASWLFSQPNAPETNYKVEHIPYRVAITKRSIKVYAGVKSAEYKWENTRTYKTTEHFLLLVTDYGSATYNEFVPKTLIHNKKPKLGYIHLWNPIILKKDSYLRGSQEIAIELAQQQGMRSLREYPIGPVFYYPPPDPSVRMEFVDSPLIIERVRELFAAELKCDPARIRIESVEPHIESEEDELEERFFLTWSWDGFKKNTLLIPFFEVHLAKLMADDNPEVIGGVPQAAVSIGEDYLLSGQPLFLYASNDRDGSDDCYLPALYLRYLPH
jgi:hypothetical protein